MKILLVDDEAAIVDSLAALLRSLPGNELKTATTGGQALQAAHGWGGVDLIITDVVMEPMDGFTLRDQLITRYPQARVIFVTGYDLSDYAEQTAGHQVLAKPVEQAELFAAIARESLAVPAPEPVTPDAAETVNENLDVPEPDSAETVDETIAIAEETVAAVPEPPAPEPEPAPVAVAPVAPAPVPVQVAAPVVAKPVAVPAATPVAVPAAVAVATPKVAAVAAQAAVAVATVKATPATAPTAPRAATAQPVAVPKASAPRAVAAPSAPTAVAATPKAVPAVATPKPVAASAPKAVAAAVPTVAAAAPKAVAAATPKVASPGVPTVAVRAGAAPTAPSVPTPTIKAAATVKAVAAPKAPGAAKAGVAARASAPAVKPAAAPVRPTIPPAPTLPDDEMVGQTIGAYELQRVLGDGDWGRVYRALQSSINRPVGFNLLSPTLAADEAARARFLGDARAKAHVQHPSILAVYEAGEAGEHIFYTHEFVDGTTVAHLKEAGHSLDEATALKVLKTVSEGLDYLHANQIPHSALTGSGVYVNTDGAARLANLATNSATDPVPVPQEIQTLGSLVLGVLPPIQSVSPGLRSLLSRMVQASPQALASWSEIAQAVKAIEPRVVPIEAARISAQDRAATAAVEAARQAQKRSVLINVGSMVSLVIVCVLAVWWWLSGGFGGERSHEELIHIPAGPAMVGNPAKKVEVGEFWIDKYEVTIGQYAAFVKALEEHPTSEYDHPDQPKVKTAMMHRPPDWKIYYGRAAARQPIHGVPSDLNMPALMVDWWDAYAYAKWKGRELPTEEEWEKAARGTDGFLYPGGNELDTKKVNSGTDYVMSKPSETGKVDGFNYWGPVDKQRDKSPFEVIGMAGNVAEWTATWTKDKKFPVIKGGNFMSPDVRLDKRTDNVPAVTTQENLGFRTVSRKAPTK